MLVEKMSAEDKFYEGFEPKSIRVNRHPESCVSRVSGTCVWLKDGTKIVLRRGRDMNGAAWLEVQPQAAIKPM